MEIFLSYLFKLFSCIYINWAVYLFEKKHSSMPVPGSWYVNKTNHAINVIPLNLCSSALILMLLGKSFRSYSPCKAPGVTAVILGDNKDNNKRKVY